MENVRSKKSPNFPLLCDERYEPSTTVARVLSTRQAVRIAKRKHDYREWRFDLAKTAAFLSVTKILLQ